nr:MAG TPA: hypothetical protein [Caudoviricetes sp.]
MERSRALKNALNSLLNARWIGLKNAITPPATMNIVMSGLGSRPKTRLISSTAAAIIPV